MGPIKLGPETPGEWGCLLFGVFGMITLVLIGSLTVLRWFWWLFN